MVGNNAHRQRSRVRQTRSSPKLPVKNADEYSVRVVYSFSTVDSDGTNTQYLKLTKDDLKQLQIVSDQLTTESR